MVSKNNIQLKDRYATKQVPHYGIRKLSVGVASVLLSTTLYMGVTAHADTIAETGSQTPVDQPTNMKSGISTSSATTDVQSTAGQLASNGANTPTGNATTDVQSKPTADQSASMATNSAIPKNETSAKVVPTVLPKQPANATDGQPTAVTGGSQLSTNFNVESDNNGSAAKPAEQSTDPATLMTNFAITEQPVDDTHNSDTTTLNSTFKWSIHYTDESGKKLLPDSMITHDYTRTDTGDQMGNWVYVPNSVKVTGTPNAGWHIDNPDFKFNQAAGGTTFDYASWYASAASIDGYIPKYSSVVITDQLPKNPESLHATTTVDSGTHEFTFVYTQRPKTVTINYVNDDDNEKVVSTGTVSGKPKAEVTITPNLPNGYMLTPGKDVPSKYTVTDGDNQVVTIHVQKQFIDVSDTDLQAKQTRTITLHYVYGGGPKDGQKAFDDAVLDVYYHRTATLDRATNQTTYGDWTWDRSQGDPSTPGYHVVSGKWTNLPQSWATVTADVPSIKGYSVDLGQNDPANTNHVPANTWVFPTYNNAGGGGHTVDGHSATAYLDGYGYEVSPTHTIVYNPKAVDNWVRVVDDDDNGAEIYYTSSGGVGYGQKAGGILSGYYGEVVPLTDPRVQQLLPSIKNVFYLTPGQAPITILGISYDDIVTLHMKHVIKKATLDLAVKSQFNLGIIAPDQGAGGLNYIDGDSVIPDIMGNEMNPSLIPAGSATLDDIANNRYPDVYQSTITKLTVPVEYDVVTKELVKVDTTALTPDVTVDFSKQLANLPTDWLTLATNYAVIDDSYNMILVKDASNKSLGYVASHMAPANDPSSTTKYEPVTLGGYWSLKASKAYQNIIFDRPGNSKYESYKSNAEKIMEPLVAKGTSMGTDTKLDFTVTQPVTVQLNLANLVGTFGIPVTVDENDDTLMHGTYLIPSALGFQTYNLKAPVTRTIRIVKPNGTTDTIQQQAQLGEFFTGKKVQTGSNFSDFHYAYNPLSDFVVANGWTEVDAPEIAGYTPSQSKVAAGTVDKDTQNQTITITYTPNKQSTTVKYIDDKGGVVHTTTVNGDTDQTVKVPFEVPAGWTVTKGQVPSEITFGTDGHEPVVITIAHQHVTVDPDHSQNNGTKLPDNPAKSFNGVETNDLNKTITRTIKVTTPDGQTKTVVQTAKFTRTADVDEVTGEVTYGKWTTGKWSNYDVPAVPGYTASQNEVPAVEVTSDMTDQTIDISYTANSQTIHINYVDGSGKIVHTSTITGKTGETVNLSLTVPDKYQLADGQQLPTTYTFTAGSGDVTIHLAHKIVQREAAVDVQIGLMTLVDVDDESEPGIVVTQSQWNQLDDEIKKSYNDGVDKVDPTVGVVGTLTGHVNYDLVDNKVVSFADDWTSLNLGGQTYQMPDGTDVVNGIIVGTQPSWGEKLKEHFLNYTDDPDYINRAWHGYLSVNKSNIDSDFAGFRLVGNEPNALAKSTDDRAATAIEMINKPIDLNSLQDRGGLSDFNEQGGQLRAKATFEVAGMYIPYVEKTATRTINVTTPDGKTTSVKQITTLAKRVTAQEDAHPDWTTGEWTSYDVPTIPGYTASQSNVAKEAVTGTTKDQTVNITYMANKQSTMIKYVDSKGQVVHTTTVDGVTDQTVKVPSEVPAGWTILKGEVPSEITFGADGYEPIEVTIDHRHITVTPDQPQNNGTKLPDNSTKTFNGVETSDLNKTITRTIKVTTPDGQTKTVSQTAKLTRTADVDEVTGEVKYGEWSTGKWSAYNVPAVLGYTASQANFTATPVDENTKDQTVEVNYAPNKQSTTIKYVDEKGNVVHTTTVNGVTGQTVTVPNEVPAGWMITKGEVPSEISFGPNGHADETITIAHQHVTVDPDHPQNNGTKLPDNPAKTFEGVEANDLNKTITRTIKVTMPDGKTTTTKQIAKLARNADVDEVTGEVTYGNWTTDEWAAYDVPSVAGYTPSQTKVNKEAVTSASKDTTTVITYSPMQHQISVEYVDDDNHGKVVKTDQVLGKTDQTITVTPSAPTNYDLVDSNNRTHTVTSADGQRVQIHVKHHQVKTNESKTVTRTINVHTPHDGVKMVNQTVGLKRDVTTDQVTGEKTYGNWTTGQWEAYTPGAIPGYTSSINEVPNTNVDGSSSDQMVDVTYTADPQKVEIVYVDDTKGGAVVKTDQVSGKTDETVKVTPDVPAGYNVVGEVPGSYTMTANGHQTITVHLAHQTKTTSEDKTVMRIINVHTPHDGVKTIKQTAMLTRTVTTDQVTGEKTYGDWSTTSWDHYEVPAVAGYVPSIKQVAQQVVNGTTTDQTIDVIYSSGEHTTYINYVDGDGNTVHTTTIKGQTDGTAQVPNETPAGWTVVGEPVPTELVFGPDGHADVTVTISHKHVTVTPDQPKTSSDKLPDNPTKTYPSGVGHDDLNKTITRTIKITTPDGQTKTVEQTAHLTRTANVDEVTGEVTYGGWTTGEWSNYDVPAVPGYTSSQSEVPATKVTDDTKDQTVIVTYTANDQTTTIDYVDQNGKTVHTTVVNGHTDQTVKVPNETPAGWIITNGQVPTEITFGSDGHDRVTVTVDHRYVTVTSDKPQINGTKLPDNPIQTFHGVAETDLNKTITRTIEVATPTGKTDTIKQTAKLTRTADVDEVTDEVTYGKWTTGAWSSYSVPTVPGYTPSQAVVAEAAVYADTTDQTVKIMYTADSHTTHINYVDEDGKVVHTTTVTGQTDQTVKVPNETPAGWTIATGQVPSEVIFGPDGYTDVTITVDHRHVTVTPDKPQTDGTKLPDNPALTFHDVDHDDLNKTVTRTIKLNVPGQDPQVITQTAHLTRTATVDEVTGEVVYGDWTSGQWDVYEVPAVDGYTASQTTIPAVNVTSETTSQDIVIDYVAVPTAQTTPINNQTDENQVTPEKVVTATNGTVQETKQDAIKNSAQSTMQDTKQLPQTGNDNRAGLLSLIGSSLMASLAIFGLGKKKKHEN